MVQRHSVTILAIIAMTALIAFIAGNGCLSSSPVGSASDDGISGSPPPAHPGQGGRLQVITSFRPFTLLVAPIGGDHIAITQILPPGADPHDYEPTPNDAVALKNGRIFFSAGPFLESWAADLASSSNPDIKQVTFTEAIPSPDYEAMKNRYAGFPDMTRDPHIWLSPQLSGYYVAHVARELSAMDPEHASDYYQNAAEFGKRLKQLDSDYTAGLSNCTTRTFLSSHSFLDYIAATYNLTQIPIAGTGPDAQPSIKQMSAIIEEAKAHDVRGILVEPDESEDLSKSISAELNLPVHSFTTMEVLPVGAARDIDNDYIAIMENNLQEMKKAMLCQ